MSILPHADPRNLGLKFASAPFALGFGSTIFQILLLREFASTFEGRETSYGFILGAWLLGGGLGSFWGNRRKARPGNIVLLFHIALIATPLTLIALRLFRPAFGFTPGELLEPGIMLTAALVLGLAVAAPFGAVFTAAAKIDGVSGRVYLWESAGAAAGGLIAYFILIPMLSNWTAAAIIGILLLIFIRLTFARQRTSLGHEPHSSGKSRFFTVQNMAFESGRDSGHHRQNIVLFSISTILFTSLIMLDGSAQRFAWRPFDLVGIEETRYGKLQVIRTDDQITFYEDGSRTFSTEDRASAEEAVHFALLQQPEAEQVLLIGGGVGGDLTEILKYPRTRADYVEFDPALIRLADRFLPETGRRSLHDPRVHLWIKDGRVFLSKTENLYDVILTDLPAPTTARINRYYTLEFFREARARLRPGGVFGFRIPSAENYFPQALKTLLRSMWATLTRVFPVVVVVPGETNVFLASDRSLTLDPLVLSDRIRRFGLPNAFVNPAMLPARLDPIRIERLNAALTGQEFLGHPFEEEVNPQAKLSASQSSMRLPNQEGAKLSGPGKAGAPAAGEINSDARPISYFYEAAAWSAQFPGTASRMISRLAAVPPQRLLMIGLVLITAVLLGFRLKPAGPTAILGPLTILGLTTMAVEIAAIAWFQSLHGYLYQSIALLLAAFMAGLTAGAAVALRLRIPRFNSLLSTQGGLILLLLAAREGLSGRPAPFLFAVHLFLVGAAAGAFFIFANALFIRDPRRAGLGYAGELLGGFIGAFSFAAVLIPLAGLSSVLFYLFLLNAIVFLVLISLRAKRGIIKS